MIAQRLRHLAAVCLATICMTTVSYAQASDLDFVTVERPPFAMSGEEGPTGFAIDLMTAIASEMGQTVSFEITESFPEMLGQVESIEADGAIANISITRDREARMDFSQPIYHGGLRIMVPRNQDGISIWSTLLSLDLALAILAAFALLLGGGMLMWFFERDKQPYFEGSARQAMFPSFWWALNLVVNGGFEERMPRSTFGRLFGTFLVISSLFVVSVFVAHITASITVSAISGSIHSVSDLDGKRVGTTEGSTAAMFLEERSMVYAGYDSLDALLGDFEQGELDAVIFDGPILAYYAQNEGARYGEVLGSVFRPESYGIALPTGSPLREEINVALLRLIETGAYSDLSEKWFGGPR
ncbi:transporter substrate-binding domain-containing protein [Aliiroseovarius sp. F20344]|uniref:transporter substrate-binding domain-containing protein n=1 Tax=Aliiroseovarius sp. F20344 TaxID=2926414 RepID=UPI001FF66183|nr:transporter substrate-binding domain-containing protein [Aliiroseovarius sp. F20344]MCK0141530.1 transporter substrate-binding domain-containing protein [Aliiroseovarius sp. F20344]